MNAPSYAGGHLVVSCRCAIRRYSKQTTLHIFNGFYFCDVTHWHTGFCCSPTFLILWCMLLSSAYFVQNAAGYNHWNPVHVWEERPLWSKTSFADTSCLFCLLPLFSRLSSLSSLSFLSFLSSLSPPLLSWGMSWQGVKTYNFGTSSDTSSETLM